MPLARFPDSGAAAGWFGRVGEFLRPLTRAVRTGLAKSAAGDDSNMGVVSLSGLMVKDEYSALN